MCKYIHFSMLQTQLLHHNVLIGSSDSFYHDVRLPSSLLGMRDHLLTRRGDRVERLAVSEADEDADVDHVVGRAHQNVASGTTGEQQVSSASHAHQVARV